MIIPVTKPFMPPLEEYESYLKGIWQRQWLTNNGPLVNELELKLKLFLDVPHMLYVNSGTNALQIAIKALELKGEIITTPFSFVATTSSIVWEGCKPVFVDIDPCTLNIDAAKIEAAITPRTSAILATHVFGNPCDIDAIEIIAKKYDLKVIYDAAHCFGTMYKGRSVFAYGNVSITSFHATKLYHSIEGGGIFTQDPELLKKMAFMRNFGFNGPDQFECLGINGKNSEFHAAMGLVNLNHIDSILSRRREIYLYYNELLQDLGMQQQVIQNHTDYNYAYYPILVTSEELVNKLLPEFYAHWIVPRRYFYPSLHTLPYVERYECPNCLDISSRSLCLPMHYELTAEEMHLVARIFYRVVKAYNGAEVLQKNG
jgi:dTDP-4-amino-4,6-dideoxygalactose transaminase